MTCTEAGSPHLLYMLPSYGCIFVASCAEQFNPSVPGPLRILVHRWNGAHLQDVHSALCIAEHADCTCQAVVG